MESSTHLLDDMRNDARQAEHHIEQQLARLEEIACVNEKNVHLSDDTAVQPGLGSTALSRTDSGHSSTNNNNNNNVIGGNSTIVDERTATGLLSRRRLPPLREVQRTFDEVQREIERSLQRFDHLVQSMQALCHDSLGAAGVTSAASRQVERLQTVSQEKWATLQRIRTDFVRRRERLELLPTVQKNVKRYEEETGMRLLMAEQNSLRHTQTRVQHILEQADDTQGRLRAQRERFLAMGGKLTEIVERVPMIHNVLRRINSKRRRDAVVLGSVIALCLFLTYLCL